MKIPVNLCGHFLIAMPTLQDTFFEKSVVYLHEYDAKGAMGIVINKSLQITLENLLQHLDINTTQIDANTVPVLSGGPVDSEQGFVIYDRLEQTGNPAEKVTISASKETLRDIAEGRGPRNFIVALGHAGWGEGQLLEEINRNDWLVAPFSSTILFETPLEKRWQEAPKLIGVDINRLGSQTGHA